MHIQIKMYAYVYTLHTCTWKRGAMLLSMRIYLCIHKYLIYILIHLHVNLNLCSHVHATGAHLKEVLCRSSYMSIYVHTKHTTNTSIFTTHTIIFTCMSKSLLTRTRYRRTFKRGAIVLPVYIHTSFFKYLHSNMNMKLCTHTRAKFKYASKSMRTHTRCRRTRKRGAIQTKESHHAAHT